MIWNCYFCQIGDMFFLLSDNSRQFKMVGMTNKSKKPIKNMKSKVSTAKVVSALHSFLTTANANTNVGNSTGTNANASADVSLGLGKSTLQAVQPARATGGS